MLQRKYTQLSGDERRDIAYYLNKRTCSLRQTARLTNRSPSTIWREIRRNINVHGNYTAADAQREAKRRRYGKCRHQRLKNNIIRMYVAHRLHDRWSPEQIAGRLSIDLPGRSISHEAIYLFAYRKENRHLARLLPSKRTKRKRRYRGMQSATALISDKTTIKERPSDVDKRILFGHWEIDSIVGRYNKSAMATFVERTSRFAILSSLADRSSATMERSVIAALGSLPKQARLSIACDNGSENARHKRIAKTLRLPIYFCDPYASWQKGSVENMNGLIRRVFPKKTDFSCVSAEDLLQLQHALNNRPRKCLGWKAPQEVFDEAIAGFS